MAILFILAALFLVAYAASCNAKMDTVKDHWSTSIYSVDKVKYNDEWFNPAISWVNKNPANWNKTILLLAQYLPTSLYWFITEVKKKAWDPLSDFWHFEKSKMICSLVASAALTFVAGMLIGHSVIGLIAAFVVMYYIGAGIVWNESFNLYYDRKLVQQEFKKSWLWIK